MYTVTNEYETYVKSEARNYSMTGSIVNKNNVTMQITRDNILEGSLSFTNRSTANNSFDIGGCCIGSMEITLQGDYHHSLYNAVITLQQGIYVTGDSYHMEKVGTWIIKKAHWNGEWVTLECYDAMCLTQKKYALTTGSFTPYSFFTAMCNDCGITLATTQTEIEAMVNGTATLKFNGSTQETDRKWSDLIHDMCAVICGFCSINRFGNLEVHQFGRCYKRIGTEKTYYTAAVDTLTKNDRITGGAFGNGAINITGLYINDRASKNADKSILVGNTTGTTLNLGYNRWLSSATSGYATMLQNILTQLTVCQFYAADVHLADVSLYDLGDLITLQAGGELSLSENILMCVMNIDYNFADESTISSYTFSEASDSSTSAVETNLTSRIETLESSQGDGGNKIYTSKSAPDNTLGNEGDLWVKYFVDYNDKLINSLGNEVDINLPRYESADDAYSYIDLTIRPQIRSICNLATTAINAFVKGFQGQISIAACQYDEYFITASQFPQLTTDTYTINNQSFNVSNSTNYIGWKSEPSVYYRYIGVLDEHYPPITNLDDFNDNLFDTGLTITVVYYYLYYNTSNKKIENINGSLSCNNVSHTYWEDQLREVTSDITIDLINTAFRTIDKIYCKIDDDWVSYDGDGGSVVVVNQILQSGTEIAQISVDGEVVSIYAPTPQNVSVTQTQTSGTEIATINVGDASTKLYAPETTVTQTLTEGTEIGEVNGTKLYAPTGGGSNVTVTPITTTGTNIANITVNGTTYQLFAPSSGGGGGHNYSTNEQVIGTWIDGSTLYEKTLSVQNNSATRGTIEIPLSDINDVTKVEGFTTDVNYNRVIPLAYRSHIDSYITETICAFYNKSTEKLVVRWQGIDFGTAYITIQYTKTS